MPTTITKTLSVTDTHGGSVSFTDYDRKEYGPVSKGEFRSIDSATVNPDGTYVDVQVGDEYIATIELSDGESSYHPPVEKIVALHGVARDEVVREDFFELLVVMRRTSRVPRGWREITYGLSGRPTQLTGAGMLLSVETPLLAEITRLRMAIEKQSWAGDVTATLVRRVTRVTKWFKVPPEAYDQAAQLPEGPIKFFAASCGPVEPGRLTELPAPKVKALTGAVDQDDE